MNKNRYNRYLCNIKKLKKKNRKITKYKSYRCNTFFDKNNIYLILYLLCFSIITNILINYLENNIPSITVVKFDIEKITSYQISDHVFNTVKLYSEENNVEFYSLLVDCMNHYNYNMTDLDLIEIKKIKETKRNATFYKIKQIYTMLLDDIKCFPVENINEVSEKQYVFDESWLAERNYGGERLHYGTDIMDTMNQRGRLKIISVSDGVVEKIGWLEMGGYRIGIRAPSGAYFYYAHLNNYEDGIKEGEQVKAGQVIAYMGDSGYGKEGTVGKFPVHLHFGISLPLYENKEETWINPYWILRYLD